MSSPSDSRSWMRCTSSVFSRRRCSRRRRSIARFRAVVVIQAPGLSGTPSTGQRSRAMANASCTASSASSKSPSTRMSVATARPTPVGRGGRRPRMPRSHVDDRPDLDTPTRRDRGERLGRLERLVQVRALDDVVAAQLFFRLGVRSVDGQDLAVTLSDRCGLPVSASGSPARIHPFSSQFEYLS